MVKHAHAFLALVAFGGFATAAAATDCPDFLNQNFRKLRSSEMLNICKGYAGKPLLIVNTASHCGFTPQFKGLQELHDKYKDRGLVVLGFPSDDFNQEDADEGKTAEVCYLNYGVKFPMVAVSHVKGAEANAVFKELNKRSTEPNWNFNKYLLSADGKQLTHYGSRTTPDSAELTQAIEAVLAKK
jgi:glutathione peroxidase